MKEEQLHGAAPPVAPWRQLQQPLNCPSAHMSQERRRGEGKKDDEKDDKARAVAAMGATTAATEEEEAYVVRAT